ncbi:MAG: Holliday junction branch migration protein RuvA [Candidatus Brennerbacteria bacterium]|nr:Holliday junction branch migration protein RuvA [Candidatus Brennerbacteria bacterium]
MIYSLKGKVTGRGDSFLVLEVGGVGFKVSTVSRTLRDAAKSAGEVKLFCYPYIREEQLELYGFREEEALRLFEMLNTVAGIGPKTALGILEVDTVPNIMAAIIGRRAELLTRTSGIGRKTAERIILELQSRIKLPKAKALTEKMDIDREVEEALIGLGYGRGDVREAVRLVPESEKTLEERLKFALKSLSRAK